jgi:hypothetical protein
VPEAHPERARGAGDREAPRGRQRGRDRRRPAPAQRPDLALPRRIKRIVQYAFRSDQIAEEFEPAARADYQEATRRPLPELVAEALTNDETADRAAAASPPQTSTSAASFSNSTHAAAPSSSSSPTRADSSSRDPQRTDNERAAPNRYESKRPRYRPPDTRYGRQPAVSAPTPVCCIDPAVRRSRNIPAGAAFAAVLLGEAKRQRHWETARWLLRPAVARP